jgi:DHA2 family multidrug resistance protein-like MFS transporter
MSVAEATHAVSSPEYENLYENPDVYRRRWWLLGVMCLSLILVVLAVTSLNVAVPSMQQDLDASATQLHWIVDAYGLVFAGLLLTAGALGDRYGRKGALLGGLGLFSVGLAVTGLGTSANQVLVGRGIMGAGAAFVMPATLSMIAAIFPPGERTKAIAIWSGFAGAGGAIGPIVSGALLESYWWGSTVLVNLPVVVLTVAAVAWLSPKSRDSHVTPLDPVGAVLSLVGVGALLYGIIEGGERGWTDSLVLTGFGSAAVLLGAFVAWELRAEHPMLPMGLFKDRRFSVGSAVITLGFLAIFGFFFLSSQYMQYVLDYSTLATGLATLPMAVAFVVFAPRSAALAERVGIGRTMAAGLLAAAVGLGVLVQVSVDTPYAILAVAFTLMGAGMGLAMAPATGAIMSAVPLDKAGVGSAVNDTTRELGIALGVAMMGSIVGSVYRSGFEVESSVPAGAREAAEESIGSAITVARDLPEGGTGLLQSAQESFVDAFRVTNAVGMAIVLATAAIAVVALRRKGEQLLPVEETDAEVDAVPFELEPAEVAG